MPKVNKKSLFVTLPGETKDTNGIPASHGVVLIIVELLLVVLPVGGQGWVHGATSLETGALWTVIWSRAIPCPVFACPTSLLSRRKGVSLFHKAFARWAVIKKNVIINGCPLWQSFTAIIHQIIWAHRFQIKGRNWNYATSMRNENGKRNLFFVPEIIFRQIALIEWIYMHTQTREIHWCFCAF